MHGTFEEGKTIEYQRRYGDKAKSEKKQRKGLPKAGGDFEGESDEEYMIEDENLREQEPHQEVLKSTKKKTPKAQDDKYRISKEYQPSTKKYDLKKRMQQEKAQKPGYEEVEEGEEELKEPYYREGEKVKGKLGKKYSHVSMEGEAGQTPTKTYDISKKQKGKQPAHAHHIKSSTSLKKKTLHQSSEEGEGYSVRSGQELKSQPSSESAKKLRKEERKKEQLSATVSPSKQKQIKADISDKKKLSHESLKKLGKKQSPRKSSDQSSEESGDRQIPQEYRKKYDIKEAVEKAAIQKARGQREPEEFEEESKHPSKGISQKVEGGHPSEIAKEISPSKKGKAAKKKPAKSRQSQMESYKAREEEESPPLVPEGETEHHDVIGYEEKTKQILVEHSEFEEERYSPEAEESKYGKAAKEKPYVSGDKKYPLSKSEQQLHGAAKPSEFEEEGEHAPSTGQMKKYRSSEELEKPFAKIRSKEAKVKQHEEFEEGGQKPVTKEGQIKRSKKEAESAKEVKGAKGKRRPVSEEFEEFEGHVERPEELEERLYEAEELASNYTEEEKQDVKHKEKDQLIIPTDTEVQQPYEHELEQRIRLPEGVLPEGEDMHHAESKRMKDASNLTGKPITPEEEKSHKFQREVERPGFEKIEEGRETRVRPEAPSIKEAYQQPSIEEESHKLVKDISRKRGELLEEGKSPSKRSQDLISGEVSSKYGAEGEDEDDIPSKIQQMRPGYKPSELEEEQARSHKHEKYEKHGRPAVSEDELQARRIQGTAVDEEFGDESLKHPQRSRDELTGRVGLPSEEQKSEKQRDIRSKRDETEEELRRKQSEEEIEEYQYSPESKTVPSGKLTKKFGENEDEEFDEEGERLSDFRREMDEGREKSQEEEKQRAMVKRSREGRTDEELL